MLPYLAGDALQLSATGYIIADKFSFVNPFFQIFLFFFWNPKNQSFRPEKTPYFRLFPFTFPHFCDKIKEKTETAS